MRLGKFNIVPDPQQNITLITSGPYRYIRHPMYLSILIFFLPPVLAQPSFSILLTYGSLTFTLIIKLHYEEHLLKQVLSTYAHYQTHSKKLIPFIY
jgi:protein-S-isoprenylcysteine O-methyltransferase Ste14